MSSSTAAVIYNNHHNRMGHESSIGTAGAGKKYTKSNKIPLRDKTRQDAINRELDEAEKAARIRSNKMLAEYRKKEQAKKSKQLSEKPKGKPSASDFVTLTQDQLATILSTIAKVQSGGSSVKVDIENDNVQLHLADSKRVNTDSENISKLEKKVKTAGGLKNDHGPSQENKKVTINLNKNAASDETRLKKSRSETSKNPATKLELDREVSYDDQVFNRSTGRVVVVQEDPPASTRTDQVLKHSTPQASPRKEEMTNTSVLSPRQKLMLIPKGHLTKGEKLRLQRELENEAVQELQQQSKARGVEPRLSDKQHKSDNKENAVGKAGKQKLSNNTTHNTNSAVVEPDFVPGLGSLSGAVKSLPSHRAPVSQHHGLSNQRLVEHKPPVMPHIFTKTELKKLQWERERAMQAPEYDPWGRPGAGVGPGSTQQNTIPQQTVQNVQSQQAVQTNLTDIELKKQQWSRQRALQELEYDPWGKPGVGVGPGATARQHNTQIGPAQGPPRSGPDNFSQPVLSTSSRPQYPANCAVVEPASVPGLDFTGATNIPQSQEPARYNTNQQEPIITKTSLTKAELLKQKWAQERNEVNPEYFPYGKPGGGAPIRTDSGHVLTNYQTRLDHVLRKSQENQQSATNQTAGQVVNTKDIYQGLPISAPTEYPVSGTTAAAEDGQMGDERTHLRGQMVNVDSGTLRQREDERKRHLLHQEDIKKQVEEKQRLKREEQERKAKEDAEEEGKLKAERNILQLQYDLEREQTKKKEEREVNRVDVLRQAMEKAKLEAEAAKARKRIAKLERAGHNVTHLKAAYEEKFMNQNGEVPALLGDISSRQDFTETSRTPAQLSSHTVAPSTVPGLEFSPRAFPTARHVEVATGEAADYTNRILTPSVVRSGVYLGKKEFGVQTEEISNQYEPVEIDITEKVKKTKKPIPKSRRQTRTIEGPTEKKKAGPVDIGSRPSWGQPNTNKKKFVPQSKKDPYYVEKKELEEERKEARKEKLLKQVAANANLLPSGVRNADEKLPSKPRPVAKQDLKINLESSSTNQKQISPRRDLTGRTQTVMSQNPYAKSDRRTKSPPPSMRKPAAQPNDVTRGVELSLAEKLRVSPTDEFVPFTRTDEVLSGSKADQPPPISREATQAALAREAYYKTMQPAQYGQHMHNIKDQPHPNSHANTYNGQKDPLYNPGLVTKHPTDRQKQMLEQLRQMRQGLMAKQREIEGFVEPQQLSTSHSYHME